MIEVKKMALCKALADLRVSDDDFLYIIQHFIDVEPKLFEMSKLIKSKDEINAYERRMRIATRLYIILSS